jgi:hypothetical protein
MAINYFRFRTIQRESNGKKPLQEYLNDASCMDGIVAISSDKKDLL